MEPRIYAHTCTSFTKLDSKIILQRIMSIIKNKIIVRTSYSEINFILVSIVEVCFLQGENLDGRSQLYPGKSGAHIVAIVVVVGTITNNGSDSTQGIVTHGKMRPRLHL